MSNVSNKRFSIKETVNKNLEKYQFPNFHSHRSLIGWCSMNYSKVLINPLYKPPPPGYPNYSKKLETLYHLKPHISSEITLKKPFTNLVETLEPIPYEGIGHPPNGFKPTTFTLTTLKRQEINEILENTHSLSGIYSPFKPISSQLGEPQNNSFSRKIKQIGEISYEPHFQTEEIRHLKKLPNSIITEQSLMDILNSNLSSLNLKNHIWISDSLISKIGYLAPNISDINLSGLEFNDSILIELGKSCKLLKKIDISKCKNLTSDGISKFLELKGEEITKFFAAENVFAINDLALKNLQFCKKLESVNFSFCCDLTDEFLKFLTLGSVNLKEIYISGLTKISGDKLVPLIKNCHNSLQILDLTLCNQKEISNSIFSSLSGCSALKSLSLTGCIHITDEGFAEFLKVDFYKYLETLKIGGLSTLTETNLINLATKCPELKFLELNNIEKLTDMGFLTIIKYLQNLEIILINQTPGISENVLTELKNSKPKLKIIRNINSYTNPKDDGLRMPFISKKIVLKKKGKKKKKK